MFSGGNKNFIQKKRENQYSLTGNINFIGLAMKCCLAANDQMIKKIVKNTYVQSEICCRNYNLKV